MFHQEHNDGHRGGMMWGGCFPKGMKKEFKMAFLNKKEKILEAKLEFVREMKALVEKMPADTKEE